MKNREGFFHLHMISDATGETLITVARAAAAQYTEVRAVEHVHSLVRSTAQLDRVIAALEEKPGIVLYHSRRRFAWRQAGDRLPSHRHPVRVRAGAGAQMLAGLSRRAGCAAE